MHKTQFTDNIDNRALRSIAEKVENNIPVSREDAFAMLATNDILELGSIANAIRTKLHGQITYYGVNMNLNYTNICELRCPLCAFSCDEDDENAFLLSLDQIEEKIQSGVSVGIDEVHIVGGLHPKLTLAYFDQMIRRIKQVMPDIHIVAFTAVEYDYFARQNRIPVEEVFRRLIEAGVDALPGGGAEIFASEVRNIIAPGKIPGDRWLQIMGIAHKLGLKTNATMLFNHMETAANIVDHLFQIRKLQDRTHGFKTFVPLKFHGENTTICAKPSPSGYDDIRLYAASRIVLHNVPHIKALWMYVGDKLTQVLQWFGVDDIGATYHNEKVVHAAGAQTPDFGSEAHLRRLINTAQRVPERTTANYGRWVRG